MEDRPQKGARVLLIPGRRTRFLISAMMTITPTIIRRGRARRCRQDCHLVRIPRPKSEFYLPLLILPKIAMRTSHCRLPNVRRQRRSHQMRQRSPSISQSQVRCSQLPMERTMFLTLFHRRLKLAILPSRLFTILSHEHLSPGSLLQTQRDIALKIRSILHS